MSKLPLKNKAIISYNIDWHKGNFIRNIILYSIFALEAIKEKFQRSNKAIMSVDTCYLH